ncbi:Crp/Fnr family transcriptional regulator [Acidaminobacter sp. JC074]|uniref:Crp/Fnr family transcriptional regulator n=1 Tax=Acidaminobacter sp. JC074 TaxID=2530199 RepID=UPI001F0E8A48|nr:Crp/Fnr family transcriptional regulator [Acidaminobacter sp. JC074]MCH4889079.1 Crp/Fnr family transcriptional regulator [Acidaminobacter sp. JC074]
MLKVLLKNPIFKDMSYDELKTCLEDIDTEFMSMDKNSVAYDFNRNKKGIMFLLKGRAKVEQEHIDGTKTFMKYIKPGDVTGVLSIFSDGDFYPTFVHFDLSSEVMYLSESALMMLIQKDKRLMRNYFSFLNGQVKYLLKRIDLFSVQNTEERVAQFFHMTMEMNQAKLELKKIELSEYLGISRSTLYRIIDKFEENQILTIKDQKIDFDYRKYALMADL